MKEKKVVFVTYGFPPKGGGGVQRNVKFLKYLNQLQWSTSVLTVKEIDAYVYDDSLLDEIKDKTVIYRADSLDPLRVVKVLKEIFTGKRKTATHNKLKAKTNVDETKWYVGYYRKIRNYILFPDGYSLWIPFAAFIEGRKLFKKEKPSVIFASFPGASNAVVSYLLHKKFKCPYVIDFRDGWLDDPYSKYPTWLHVKGQQYLEKKILSKATSIIVYGQVLKDRFETRYPGISKKIHIIPNGFDPEDFLALNPIEKNKDKIRFIYSGNLFGDRKQNFEIFLKALNLLPKDIGEKIEVIVVGPAFDGIKEIIESEKLSDKITITGYLPHLEALNYLTTADVGIVFLPPNEFTGVTGKVFEYIGLGHTILACVEKEGACANLLKSINSDIGVCQPDNPQEIADTILKLNKLNWPRINEESAKQFSRKYHTNLLSEILESSIKI